MIIGKRRYGMGWIPDYPDFRDYTEKTEGVKQVLEPTGVLRVGKLPVKVDLREWCSPVEDQGKLGSCKNSGDTLLISQGSRV